MKCKIFHRKKMLTILLAATVLIVVLVGRLVYLMIFQAEYYQKKAQDLHERERDIKAARGEIVDVNGVVLATNKAVCTISIIHNQIEEPERVIEVLAKELEIDEEIIRKKVEKISSIERIKSNVDKIVGDNIRAYSLDGVKVDEDYKRYYPYENLASKVIGFTGADNQGVIGLEVKYEEYIKGLNGKILTTTDARGIELDQKAEERVEPIPGNTLKISLDYNVQTYAQQAAEIVLEEKEAEKVAIIIMNPQNGEIIAMVNVPEFNLNAPFELPGGEKTNSQDLLNQMWRNSCINDTYEPGSIFKIVTTAACLEEKVVGLEDSFYCPGYKVVEDRRIRCHKTIGHGSETFLEAVQNSCNPVFMEIGLRLGVDKYFDYFEQFDLNHKTGIDLPGEATTITHKKENVGAVELATMTFGQSFQVSPIRMATTVCELINGGKKITPHFGMQVLGPEGEVLHEFSYSQEQKIISEKTSEQLQNVLESVVSEGSGKNAYIEGYEIGGKTATSETLPRSANKYISSFLGFAPADNPSVLGMILIYDPKGVYYGGTIAAPVLKNIFENILPYLGIEKTKE